MRSKRLQRQDGTGEAELLGHRAGPWGSRLLFAIAVVGPPLAIGGVHPVTVTAFLVVVTLAWARVGLPARGSLVVPVFAAVGLAATTVTLAQWLPWPGLREWAAPRMAAMVGEASVGLASAARDGLTPVPGDTGLEVARLLGLSILFVLAAQLRWRTAATVVAAAGTAVALVGLAHETLGIERIYGFYGARDLDLASAAALRGPFVNANHQSGLLLLGIFASAALATDHSRRGLGLADPRNVDRCVAATAALLIQVPALVLSLSRAALVLFLVLAPIAGLLAWSRPRTGLDRVEAPRMGAKLAIVIGVIALFATAAGRGAWHELSSIASLDDSEATLKFATARQALGLVELSPALGIGRGAFVDVYPAIEPIPSHRLTTHLECAPVTMLVEWGPVFGGLLVLGVLGWFASAWFGGEPADRCARRIALVGLFAVGIQSLADFSLEFLGVAAPAVALAGGLAAGPVWHLPKRRVVSLFGAALLAGIALSVVSAPDAQMARVDSEERILADERAAASAIARRPLDGRLHGLLARRAAESGRWPEAAVRARVATRLRPGNLDAWLLRGAAAHVAGDSTAANASIARALGLVHDVPSVELLAWLLARYPHPQELAALCPANHAAWRLLVDALVDVSPRHADALADARASARPRDPEPVKVRHAIAMRTGEPALALHHARLLRQLAPGDAAAHIGVSHALRSFMPPRLAEARDSLTLALDSGALTDSSARGELEEELVVVLLALGDPGARARARLVVADLLTRPADRDGRAFRERLAVQARATEREPR